MLTYAVDTGQAVFEGEFRIPTKGGDVKWVEAHQRIAYDEAGVVLGVSLPEPEHPTARVFLPLRT